MTSPAPAGPPARICAEYHLALTPRPDSARDVDLLLGDVHLNHGPPQFANRCERPSSDEQIRIEPGDVPIPEVGGFVSNATFGSPPARPLGLGVVDREPTERDAIDALMARLAKTGSTLRVRLNAVVNSANLVELPVLAAYARRIGVAGITFDPIRRYLEHFTTLKFEDMFAMAPEGLEEVVGELSSMKRSGYPILNSEESMLHWGSYADLPLVNPCKVPPERSVRRHTWGHEPL